MPPPHAETTCRSLYLLPIVTFMFVPGCFTITYLIAVFKDHVHPVLPMISETGEESPENFVFAIVVNVGAFFGTLNYLARYFVLSRWSRQKPCMGEPRGRTFDSMNRTSLCVALCGVLGALLVANVEANRHLYIHNIGAIVCVVMGLAYSWMHTYLTYVSPMRRWTLWLRLTLTVVMTVALVTGASAVPYAHSVPELDAAHMASNGTAVDVHGARFMGYRWVSDKHDYFNALLFYHFTEWLIVFCSGLFLLSFTVEFRHVTIAIPQAFFALTPVHGRHDDDDDREMMDFDAKTSSPLTAAERDAQFTHMMRNALQLDEKLGGVAASSLPILPTPKDRDGCCSAAPSSSHHTRTGSMTTRPLVGGKHQRTRSNGTTIRVIDEFGTPIPFGGGGRDTQRRPSATADAVEFRSPIRH